MLEDNLNLRPLEQLSFVSTCLPALATVVVLLEVVCRLLKLFSLLLSELLNQIFRLSLVDQQMSVGSNHYLKLYFGANGMQLGKIRLKLREGMEALSKHEE